MSRFVAAVVLVLAACGGGARPQPPAVAAPEPPSLERARAFELGKGVRRNYEQAAAIYQALCADGAGDLAACRRLLTAIAEDRGADGGRGRVASLALAMCEQRDVLGCAMAGFMFAGSGHMPPAVEAGMAGRAVDVECQRGDESACLTLLVMEFPNFQGSGGADEKNEERAGWGCDAGVLEGCLRLIREVDACGDEAGAERCVGKLVTSWIEYQSPKLVALQRVTAACDDGDAVACASLPGRELPHAELCKARDFAACAAAGCLGDNTAAAIARNHRVEVACGGVRSREEARSAPPPRTREALAAANPLPPSKPATLPPFRSVAFRQLATDVDSWQWPDFEIANLGTRKIVRLRLTAYAYDRAGKQVATSGHESVGPMMIGPGKTQRTSIRGHTQLPDDAVTFDVCYDFISFEGATRSAIGGTHAAEACPAQWVRGFAGPALDASGSLAQRRFHGAARRGVAHYATTDGSPAGASADALAELAAGEIAFAGSDVPGPAADTVSIPVLLSGIGILYNVRGVTDLRLSPATLAKIFQGDIKTWNHAAIRKDNPRTKLPATPIVLVREIGWDGNVDRDLDATRQLATFLARASGGVWRLGSGPTIAWPGDMKRTHGLMVSSFEGAISYIELSHAKAEGVRGFARLRNRAGAYVAPELMSLQAAAIDPKAADGYPITYQSSIVVPIRQPDPARRELLVGYLRYLLGDGQWLLDQLGQAPLPGPALARSRALVDGL